MPLAGWALFADLDGTVLDKHSYEPGPALRALERCREAGVPVVFSSSKTRSEMLYYYNRFCTHETSPFISENGGGVFLPAAYWDQPPQAGREGDFWKVTLGAPYEKVKRILSEASREVGICLRSFSNMLPEEIASATGLSVDQAGLAMQREFDEPFWVDEKDFDKYEVLEQGIRQKGMQLTRGGRCFHIHGDSHKGKAVEYVKQLYLGLKPLLRFAAVGDAANDLPMFLAVERAYLVKGGEGNYDPDIPRKDHIRFLAGRGPSGFSQAVEDLL